MTHLGGNPLPDEPQAEAMRKARSGSLWGGLFVLMVGCIVALVFYALLHDPTAQRASLAPAPGAALLPDSPASTTTGQGVPLPGDRATGTVAGPDVKTAPPPMMPAGPVIQHSGAAPSAPINRTPGRPAAEDQEIR